MLINEEKLRMIIRETLMLEITNFGSMTAGGSIRVDSSTEEDCPYYTSSLENLQRLIIDSQFNPLTILFKKFGPERVQSALNKNIDFEEKFNQFLKFTGMYSKMLGTPCMAYFLLDRLMIVLLDIEEILTGVRPGRAVRAGEVGQDNEKTFDYFKGIREKADLLERRTRESHNFISSLSYYVLPNLHKLGPNNVDIAEFEKDLKILAEKIDKINDISSNDVQEVHKRISKITETSETNFVKSLGAIGIGKDITVSNNLKKQAHESLLRALGLAIEKDYKSSYRTNSDFRDMADKFFNTSSI